MSSSETVFDKHHNALLLCCCECPLGCTFTECFGVRSDSAAKIISISHILLFNHPKKKGQDRVKTRSKPQQPELWFN